VITLATTRRTFLACGAAFLAAPLAAEAQQTGKVWRVGLLEDVSGRNVPWFAAFEHRLRDLGYDEGKNLSLEFRTAGGQLNRITALAAELVRLNPDAIVNLGGAEGVRALKHQTNVIPIVFSAIEWDPLATGVVATLAHPGGNLTGISALAVELAAKRLELLRELIPGARSIAVLWHKARAADQFRVLRRAAEVLQLHVVSLEVGVLAHDLDSAFARAAREPVNAVLILGSPAFFPERQHLADLGLRYRLPTSFQLQLMLRPAV
jgi:putative ABC transport system substrate-binding protein